MHKTTRVSVDFPYEGHILLKMLCAKKGISIRKYIIDMVLKGMREEPKRQGSDQETSEEIDDKAFKKAADKLMKTKNSLWKRLADR